MGAGGGYIIPGGELIGCPPGGNIRRGCRRGVYNTRGRELIGCPPGGNIRRWCRRGGI